MQIIFPNSNFLKNKMKYKPTCINANLSGLSKIWSTTKNFRILATSLFSNYSNVPSCKKSRKSFMKGFPRKTHHKWMGRLTDTDRRGHLYKTPLANPEAQNILLQAYRYRDMQT